MSETERIEDLRQAGAARGAVLVEQVAAAVHGAVVVTFDRGLEFDAGFHRPVFGMQAQRVEQVGGRVLGVELPRHRVLLGVERRAFLLVVGAAEVRAQDCAVRVERNRGLDLDASGHQVTPADQRQRESEVRHRIGVVQLQRAFERVRRGADVDLGQRGITGHHVPARQVGIQFGRARGFGARGAVITQRQFEFGQSGPGQRVFGFAFDRQQQLRAGVLDIQFGLQHV